MQHDASRCVQGVLQFGNEEERRAVVMELCSSGAGSSSGKKESSDKRDNQSSSNINLAELCKIQYAHFVVLKMIKYCARDEACVKSIVKVSSIASFNSFRFNYKLCVLTDNKIMMNTILEPQKANDQSGRSLCRFPSSRTALRDISIQINLSP